MILEEMEYRRTVITMLSVGRKQEYIYYFQIHKGRVNSMVSRDSFKIKLH